MEKFLSRKKFFFCLFLASLWIPVTGCATFKEKKLEVEGLTLIYRDQSVLGSKAKNLQLQHPSKVTEDKVRAHLSALIYEEMSLLSKKKFVFKEEEIDRMSRLLTKAYNRATHFNVIHLEVATRTGPIDAETFIANNQMHWRFSKIRGLRHSNSPRSTIGHQRGPSNWRLVLNKGQRYFTSGKLMGKFTHENWIMASLDNPPGTGRIRKSSASSRKKKQAAHAKDKAEASPAKEPSTELEKKLKTLKQLHDKKLINDKEYQQKRQELLNNYL